MTKRKSPEDRPSATTTSGDPGRNHGPIFLDPGVSQYPEGQGRSCTPSSHYKTRKSRDSDTLGLLFIINQ